jgi:DNA-binding NtrC family response regulator
LFLDEIGELELPLQAQLLRVIQERSFKRVGGNNWLQADFRLICATNRDLEQDVGDGRFRADLNYRIADRVLCLPPLRERREDIMPLAAHFWRNGGPAGDDPEYDPALAHFLLTRNYPGNVRDLRRIVIALRAGHAGGGIVSIGALPEFERPIPCMAATGRVEPAAELSTGDWDEPGFLGAIEAAIARGTAARLGSRGYSHLRVRIVGGLEALSEAGAKSAIIDCASNLKQQIGATP